MLRHQTHVCGAGLRAWALALCLLALAACAAPPVRAQSASDPVYVFHTNLGNINVQLFPDVTPKTVANFLNYVNKGAYNGSFIHRATTVANSGIAVIQGGGYTDDNTNGVRTIAADPPVVNEFHLSNVRGTIAMAKTSNPNSATNEWFFNDADNSTALDNPSNSGGFTVFGRIVDAAGLAVMDRIAAVPTYNEGSPFNQLPVINYSGSGSITPDQLITVTAITPLAKWTAMSVSVGADGDSRLLWDKSDGTAALWKLDPSGSILVNAQYGPYSGWTARAVATTKDGSSHVLWVNTSGKITLWLMDSNNNLVSQQQYGPYSGWSPVSLAAAPGGSLRLLWDNTDGHASLWTFDGGNNYKGQQQYGPYSGWTARSVTVGADGLARLLWTNVSGLVTVWRLNAQSQLQDQQQSGPYNGWTAQAVAAAPDGTLRLVWQNVDTHISLWTLDSTGAYTGQQHQYGPYSGWGIQALAVGGDGNARLLWDNASGQSALWSLTPGGSFVRNDQFGPY